MRISRIQIENFRNFQRLDVETGSNIVIVGENTVGKSNFLFALRLILDPTLPDSTRQLRQDDFWDGLTKKRRLSRDDRIQISVDLTDFEDNDDQLAILAEHLVQAEPMVARLSYVFQSLATLEDDPCRDSDFEFFLYGGDRPENRISSDIRRRMPLNFWNALRDAEGDLSNWRHSPLRPLLDHATALIDQEHLKALAQDVTGATEAIAETDAVEGVNSSLHDKLVELVGSPNAIRTALGFTPADAERLIRSLRLFIDGGRRSISEASLGMANVIYLALESLHIDLQIEEGRRCHTFLAIEEPEAHLHPNIQRRLFRTFLRARQPDPEPPRQSTALHDHGGTILLTTHSPHLASVSPAQSFLLLRQDRECEATEAVTTASLDLTKAEIDDIERYLDVTRGEALFARAILFVEGEAEEYLVPVLAKLLDFDLDELGVSVCSVAGTHFLPYVKFFGPQGLNIPFAVISDSDPGTPHPGIARFRKVLSHLCPEEADDTTNDDELVALAAQHGLFLTEQTFEVALWKSGRKQTFLSAMRSLGTKPAKSRAKEWANGTTTFDPVRMLKDIDGIGKGRFAQRWAYFISLQDKTMCPKSIAEALKHVADKIA